MNRHRQDRPAGRSRRAFALLVALGMLGLLSVLASVFAVLSGVERKTAGNYVSQTRAYMLALSGVETAFALLRSSDAIGPRSRYLGEDWNGDLSPIGTPDGDADDANGNRNGMVDTAECDPRHARRPSFFVDRDNDGLPDLIPVNENGVIRMRGYSGSVAGTHHEFGDTFVLKVLDTSALVSINQAGDGYRRLYDNLGALLIGNGVPNLGAAIQAGQPYATVDELVSQGVITPGQLEVLRPFIGVIAWQDPTTIRPDPQTETHARPENLRRADWLEPRAPINVNTAPFVVIKAVLLGIAGYNTDRIVPRKRSFSLSAAQADQLARALVAAREETFTDTNGNGFWDAGEPMADLNGNGAYDGPFRTWQQFEEFVGTVPGFGARKRGNGQGQGQNLPPGQAKKLTWPLDLVMANCNPNTDLNCLFPEHQLWRAIDKSDLIATTTEFTFQSSGQYLVRSLGRVTTADFATDGEREIEVTFRLYDIVRLTSQEDFENAAARVGSPSPDVMSLPEEVAQMTVEPYVDVNRNGRFDGPDTFTDLNGDGMRDGPAIYDGQIVLRPSDPPGTQPWGDPPAQLGFRCLINDSPSVGGLGPAVYPSFTGDTASPTPARGIPLASGSLRTTVDQGNSLLRDLDGANDYPDLTPNGMLLRAEFGEAIYWDSILNWPVGSGSLNFWIKPHWDSHPQANHYKDVLAMNQQFALDPNRGRLLQLYAVHFGLNPSLFFLEGHYYTRSRRTAATETADDGGIGSNWASTRYRLHAKGDWIPDQWHHFAIRWSEQIRCAAWMDALPFEVGHETKNPGGGGSPMNHPSPTHNLITLGSHMPWSDAIGTGTYDDFRTFRSAVPATDVGLTPAWRYDDTPIAGFGTWSGRAPIPANGTVRSFAWTEWRPLENYQGDELASTGVPARQLRPDVRLQYRAPGETAWRDGPGPATPDGPDGGEFLAAPDLGPTGSGVEFRFVFDRQGQDPFRNTPVVDDLTITYTTGGGVRILSWRIVP